jgi:hypothetical protein
MNSIYLCTRSKHLTNQNSHYSAVDQRLDSDEQESPVASEGSDVDADSQGSLTTYKEFFIPKEGVDLQVVANRLENEGDEKATIHQVTFKVTFLVDLDCTPGAGADVHRVNQVI